MNIKQPPVCIDSTFTERIFTPANRHISEQGKQDPVTIAEAVSIGPTRPRRAEPERGSKLRQGQERKNTATGHALSQVSSSMTTSLMQGPDLQNNFKKNIKLRFS